MLETASAVLHSTVFLCMMFVLIASMACRKNLGFWNRLLDVTLTVGYAGILAIIWMESC